MYLLIVLMSVLPISTESLAAAEAFLCDEMELWRKSKDKQPRVVTLLRVC
jgi:hypothetical protein